MRHSYNSISRKSDYWFHYQAGPRAFSKRVLVAVSTEPSREHAYKRTWSCILRRGLSFVTFLS